MSALPLDSPLRGALRDRLPARPVKAAITLGVGLLCIAAVAAVPVGHPSLWRDLFGAAVGINLLVLAVASPRSGAMATLMFLPFLALARRLLIPAAGWTSTDPLLLAGPFVAGFLWLRLFVIERRPLVTDRLSRLLVALLALVIVQSFSPLGPGVKNNLSGLLFMGVPLLWFFIGRELAGDREVRKLFVWVLATGFAICLYSIWQTRVAFPSWDAAWLKDAGYSALYVTQGTARAFGTFSSGQEDAAYIGIMLVVVLVLALHRQPLALVLAPLPLVAIFLESSRGIFLTTIAVVILTIALRPRNGVMALAVAALTVAVLAGGLTLAKGSISQSQQSGNALVAHQVGGLLNPTNSQDSTLSTHVNLIGSGLRTWMHNPLGLGAGSTVEAGVQLSSHFQSQTTEIDFTNTLIALGLLGPLLYIPAIVIAFSRAVRRYFRQGQYLGLAVIGIMVLTLGTWLNGGEWAVSPIIWFLIGWTAGRPLPPVRQRLASSAPSAARADRSPSAPVHAVP